MGNCIAASSNKLSFVEYKNTTPFIPPVTSGKVIKVYDGDTITIASTLPFRDNRNTIYRFSVRLGDIDSPAKNEMPRRKRSCTTRQTDAL